MRKRAVFARSRMALKCCGSIGSEETGANPVRSATVIGNGMDMS